MTVITEAGISKAAQYIANGEVKGFAYHSLFVYVCLCYPLPWHTHIRALLQVRGGDLLTIIIAHMSLSGSDYIVLQTSLLGACEKQPVLVFLLSQCSNLLLSN